MEHVVVHPVNENVENKCGATFDPKYAIRLECLCKDFSIHDFKLTNDNPDFYALYAMNLTKTKVTADGNCYCLNMKQDNLLLKNFNTLKVNSKNLNP